ncbi:type II toxin-antitoxin system RatA family toxin [Rhodospira trueperi]|uniref:Ribosome association toxin PasT (RatA) of the RatAB toxin-antitoxin module n=1 Tax=Rhodospira trueperi TaxID=69960 RepID=A0A1G7F611_9PROT|nr:SRPBCC family protein [Rhodospira trueperi]SDE71311.1 Ribosome association toxin PasT (RatA) of the RatAB toxin-antitoxin module [Rhodospira trueperi]
MPTLSLQRDLPYPRPAVYEAIADVARYPEFMPGFKRVRTEGWEDDALRVRQTVGMAGLTVTFLSRARFTEPERIDIVSHERPFQVLSQIWRFEERPNDRTRLHLKAEYGLVDRMAGAVFERVYPGLMRGAMTAIGRRVAALSRRTSSRGETALS